RDHINMPDFLDYQGGFHFTREDLRVGYLGSRSTDGYSVVIPRQTNILSKVNPHFGDPTSQPFPDPRKPDPPDPPKSTPKISVDSISSVAIGNQVHFLSLAWDVDPRNFVEH